MLSMLISCQPYAGRAVRVQAHIRLHAMEQEDRDREQSKVAALLHETSKDCARMLHPLSITVCQSV